MLSSIYNAACNHGLLLAARVGSPTLASIFFGETSYATNSRALAIAADKKHYDVTEVLLTKGEGSIFGPYDFLLGSNYRAFESAAARDPILGKQLARYNEKIGKTIDWTIEPIAQSLRNQL